MRARHYSTILANSTKQPVGTRQGPLHSRSANTTYTVILQAVVQTYSRNLKDLVDAATRHYSARRHSWRSPFKGLWLFILPIPLLLAAVVALARGEFASLVANASGFALFMLAGVWTRRGLLAAQPTKEHKHIQNIRIPLKNLGAATLVLATTFTAFFAAQHTVTISIVFGLVALLAFHLLYRLEPWPRRQAEFSFGVNPEEAAKTLDQAEQRILAIEKASRDIGNLELKDRLQRISGRARKILQLIEDNPRDLRRARKFLTVYLEGTQKVTEGYAQTHQMTDSRELEHSFRNVLITIEEVFAQQQQHLLENNVMDLDVQIEVLAKQLKQEGII